MINPEQPDISRRLKALLEQAKQQHGYIPRKQPQNGNIPMKEQSVVPVPRFRSELGNTPPRNTTNTTNFGTWIDDCGVSFKECGDIKACLKNVSSTHGRFISESNSKGEIVLRTTDSSQGILLVQSQAALEALMLHVSIDSNFRK